MTKMLDDSPRQIMKRARIQFTRQRALVLDIMKAGHPHLDAYDVYEETHRLGEAMSLSTVYRILQVFKGCGLLMVNHLGEDHHHYEVDSGKIHHHAVCLRCGSVIEFAFSTEALSRSIPELVSFTVATVELSLEGICGECGKREGRGE